MTEPDPPPAPETPAEEPVHPHPNVDDAHLHSVFDEPAIFPRNEKQLIDSDWPCSKCGYNLRGLTTGNRQLDLVPLPEVLQVEAEFGVTVLSRERPDAWRNRWCGVLRTSTWR